MQREHSSLVTRRNWPRSQPSRPGCSRAVRKQVAHLHSRHTSRPLSLKVPPLSYGNEGGRSSSRSLAIRLRGQAAHDSCKTCRWWQAQFVEPRQPDPRAGNRQDAAGNHRCMQGRSPEPCRCRACSAQAGGPHRRAHSGNRARSTAPFTVTNNEHQEQQARSDPQDKECPASTLRGVGRYSRRGRRTVRC